MKVMKPIDTAEYLIQNCSCTCVSVQRKGQNGGYVLNSKTHRNFWLLAWLASHTYMDHTLAMAIHGRHCSLGQHEPINFAVDRIRTYFYMGTYIITLYIRHSNHYWLLQKPFLWLLYFYDNNLKLICQILIWVLVINNVYVKIILDFVKLVRVPCNLVVLQMLRNPCMSFWCLDA